MVGIEEIEEERPDFLESDLVIDINSPVDGEEIKYFPPNIKARRNLIAWTVILVASTAVMALVIATFFLKAILAVRNNLLNTRHWNCEKNQRQFSGSPKCVKNYGIPRWLGIDMSGEIGNTLVSLAQAAQIFALENVFNELALFLNRYENHATDTEFTDKLTEKVFIFQGINLCGNQPVRRVCSPASPRHRGIASMAWRTRENLISTQVSTRSSPTFILLFLNNSKRIAPCYNRFPVHMGARVPVCRS